jgi:PAS domain S-box-containing protein
MRQFVPVVFLLLFACCARAQNFDEAWRWVQFTKESGLPSNNVLEVVETPDSTLWAICDAGVAWFDGFQWQPVQLPPNHVPSAKTIVCDYRNDSLLIGFGDEWYILGRQGYTRLSTPPLSKLRYLSGDTIICLNKGTLSYMIGGRLPSGSVLPGPANRKVEEIIRTKGGGVWATTEGGLYRWEEDRWERIFNLDVWQGTKFTITENSAGSVYAFFGLPIRMRGLWHRERGSRIAHRIDETAEDINSMAITQSQALVAAYFSGYVRIRSDGVWSTSPLLQSKCKGLSNLMVRKNGDLLISGTEGLNYFMVSSLRWRLLFDPGTVNGAVNEILLTRSGETWIALSNTILVRNASGTSRIITHIDGVPMVTVTGLAEDRDGNIWISSGGTFSGAYRWDGSTWKHFAVSKSLGGIRIHKIRRDRHGRLWFLGLPTSFQSPGSEEPAVFVLDQDRFTEWAKEHNFPASRVYAFDEDASGGLWFATHAGISRWKDGVWQRWTDAEGLRHNRVFSLAIDQQCNVWFGHQHSGFGLGCIDSSGKIRYITSSDGLINDFVWEVRVDSQGVLWATTRGGLTSYHGRIWSRFEESSGLPSNLLWPVLPLRDEVLVGTHGKGVAILNRRESFPPSPRIVIDKPVIDRQDVYLRWQVYAYRGSIPPAEIITQYRIDDDPWSDWSKTHEAHLNDVPAGDHTLMVKAQGLFSHDSQQPMQMKFTVPPPVYLRPAVLIPAVIMAGSLLALGVVFIIRKRRYHADLRQREARFRAVTESTSSAIFIYDRERMHFMNSSAEVLTGYRIDDSSQFSIADLILPEEIDEFLKHLEKLRHDPSGRVRSEIRIVTKSGDIRWLDFTSGPIGFHDEEMRIGTAFDITDRKNSDEKLRSLTSELISTEERERRRVAIYLHDVIGQTLALSKIKLRSIQKSDPARVEPSHLQDVLDLIDDSIKNTRSLTFDLCPPILYELSFTAALRSLTEQLLEPYGIHLELRCDDESIPLKDEIKVVAYHAVREIIVNTIKHAHATRVTLHLGVRDSRMWITISDDGTGFTTSEDEGHIRATHGFGLFNIRERLSHLGGSLEIHSTSGNGTTASIEIPVDTNQNQTMSERYRA